MITTMLFTVMINDVDSVRQTVLLSIPTPNRGKRQVLFVAMDEVSFNFMDALAPGSAVLFRQESSVRFAFFSP